MADEDDVEDLEALDEGHEQGGEVQGDDEQEDVAQAEDAGEEEGQEQGDVVEAGEEQPQRGSRASRRIQKLNSELNELRERDKQRDQQLREVTERLARQEQPRREAPKEPTEDEMALWSPQQVIDYRVKKGLEPVLQSVQQIQATTYETGDRASFQAVCAGDPRAAKMRDEVERFVATERQRGNNISREVAYTFLLGQKIRAGKQQVEQQRASGQQRIRRQQASGSSPRGDESGQRRALSEKEARNKRLENATF